MSAELRGAGDAPTLNNRVSRDLESLRDVPQKLKETLLQLRRELLSIAGQTRLTPQAMRDDNKAAQQKALDATDRLLLDAEAAKKNIEGEISAVFQEPTDSTQRLTMLMEREQTWRRAERLLKTLSPLEVIQQAGSAGDLLTLQTLRVELPSYLTAKGEPQESIDGYMQALEQAERPLLLPGQRASREIQEQLAIGWSNISCSAGMARMEAQGNGPQTLLPGWEKGAILFINSEMPDIPPSADQATRTRLINEAHRQTPIPASRL